jgi:hypothetical protein
MRLRRRLGFLAFLIAVAVAFVWLAPAWLRRGPAPVRPLSVTKPILNRGVTAPLNQPGGGMAPAEAYQVYSALYQTPVDEPLAFAEDSWTDVPQVGECCLRPSTPEEHEMADAFGAANQQSHRWEQKFSIAQGYWLFSASEALRARQCLSPTERNYAQCASYKQLRYVRLLGMPGFDHAHTRALVSVIKRCSGFCGSGGIFEVQKLGGEWQRVATTNFTRNCSWMY